VNASAVAQLAATDEQRFAQIEESLHTCVVGDVLDQMGRYHQILSPQVKPIEPGMVLVGRAMPVLIVDVHGPQLRPFGRLTETLDQLQPGEIYLARGSRLPCAAWGELLTLTARMRGARGAVLDGYHRDTDGILTQHWPVFSHGKYSQDAGVRASVVDYRVPVDFDGVSVRPGDLVFGDQDGVVVVPREIEDEVLQGALDKVNAENRVRAAISAGMSSTEAFATFGVL
jgi:4-hydroxy-4-methyl-2-oxoglutarate aldolase